jgi:hypothetical protein
MIMEYNAQKEAERKALVQKFLDTECESAITTAASNGKAECFVEVPTDMYGLVCSINANLTAEGYFSQARHGSSNIAIQIRW